MRILRTTLLGLLALGLLGVQSMASAALINGLVAYYPLDGNANDSSTNANDMTENGAGVSYAAGRVGQAVDLTPNSWLSVTGTDLFGNTGLTTADTSATAYTWQAWVNPLADVVSADDYILATTLSTQSPGQGFAIAGRIDTSEQLDVFRQEVGLGFWANHNNPLPAALSDGWYHVLVTWDTTSGMDVYVNGDLDNGGEGQNGAGSELGAALATDGLNIGADQNSTGQNPGRFFDGLIDEVAIWDRVLTSGEIAELYNNGVGITIAIPEPSSLLLMGLGMMGLMTRRKSIAPTVS